MADHRLSLADGTPFPAAVAALRAAAPRREVQLEEVPAPGRLARDALALSADVVGSDGEDAATGRFVLLHDPDAPGAWSGPWRVVTYARAQVETDVADDPLLADIGWTWLREALTRRRADHRGLAGTVTRVVNERFGELAGAPVTVELEVRASWSPLDAPHDVGAHLLAWTDLVAELAGLPPVPDGVSALPSARW